MATNTENYDNALMMLISVHDLTLDEEISEKEKLKEIKKMLDNYFEE